jgi:hypothetical protein
MGSVPEEEAIPKLEELLEKLAGAQAAIRAHEAAAEKMRQDIVDQHAAPVDALTVQSEELVGEITEIFTEHRAHLLASEGKPRKSVVLRGGELSARFANEALEINEAKAERWLRRKGKWLKYSKAVKRKLDKTALKKDKALVNSAPDDVMRFVQNENLLIKLPKLQLEIKRVLNPLRSRLTGTSD